MYEVCFAVCCYVKMAEFDFQSYNAHEVISAVCHTSSILSGISSALCWIVKIMCLS